MNKKTANCLVHNVECVCVFVVRCVAHYRLQFTFITKKTAHTQTQRHARCILARSKKGRIKSVSHIWKQDWDRIDFCLVVCFWILDKALHSRHSFCKFWSVLVFKKYSLKTAVEARAYGIHCTMYMHPQLNHVHMLTERERQFLNHDGTICRKTCNNTTSQIDLNSTFSRFCGCYCL